MEPAKHVNAYLTVDGQRRCVGTFGYDADEEQHARFVLSSEAAKVQLGGGVVQKKEIVFIRTDVGEVSPQSGLITKVTEFASRDECDAAKPTVKGN